MNNKQTTLYYIALKQHTNHRGFGYQTNDEMRKLWDGKGWTTDKNQAVRCDNNPRMRMIASRLLDAEVVTL